MEVTFELLGRPMRMAEEVRLGQVNWFEGCILYCYQMICAKYNVIGCITGGVDAPDGHSEADHSDCRALDLRCRDFERPELVAAELATRLHVFSPRFMVLYLDIGHGPHFHAAWR